MSPVNFAYLEGFLNGDQAVIVEVLKLFRQQGGDWRRALAADNPDWRKVAHAIKGAARGVGAAALGDACETAEFGRPEDLPPVHVQLDAALSAIADYLNKVN